MLQGLCSKRKGKNVINSSSAENSASEMPNSARSPGVEDQPVSYRDVACYVLCFSLTRFLPAPLFVCLLACLLARSDGAYVVKKRPMRRKIVVAHPEDIYDCLPHARTDVLYSSKEKMQQQQHSEGSVGRAGLTARRSSGTPPLLHNHIVVFSPTTRGLLPFVATLRRRHLTTLHPVLIMCSQSIEDVEYEDLCRFRDVYVFEYEVGKGSRGRLQSICAILLV